MPRPSDHYRRRLLLGLGLELGALFSAWVVAPIWMAAGGGQAGSVLSALLFGALTGVIHALPLGVLAAPVFLLGWLEEWAQALYVWGAVGIGLLPTGAGILSLLGLVTGKVLGLIESPTEWAIDLGSGLLAALVLVIAIGHLGGNPKGSGDPESGRDPKDSRSLKDVG